MVETVKELCEKFFYLENKYNLNQMKIHGVFFWQLIRVHLYYELSRKTGVFGSSSQQSTLTLKDKILSFIPFIKNSLFYNPLQGKYNKEILIFDHPRKVKVGKNGFQDIYTYFLTEILDKNDFEVIESPYLNKHFTKKEDYIKYNDRILLGSYIYKKRTVLNFCENFNKKISTIEKEIISLFNVEIDLSKTIKNHILDFKYQYKKYNELFKKRKPTHIFIVVSYENQAIVAAAKDSNITVIELQHGVISKYHLGYNYPDNNPNNYYNIKNNKNNKNNKNKDNNINDNINTNVNEIAYFPDKILTFGNYWNNITNYPIASENLISMGFPYLEKNIEYYKKDRKNEKQILFISQGVIGKFLSKFAYNLSKSLTEYNIVYKLHPGEYANWKNDLNLVKASKLDNFKIIDNSNISLYELFSTSQYQVGVFSTAIYEGLAFNCKTFIVNLPGSEYLDDLLELSNVLKVNNHRELEQNISNTKTVQYDKDFFFKKYDKEIINKVLKKDN